MTDEQARDWEYRMICCLGISTSNSDINVVGLHKTVKELYEQGRADEREAQVCCGDYEKCMKACTPRGRWLAEKELAKPEQEPVAWMVRDQVDGCRYPSALKNPAGSINGESQPLYTAPPKREWVGLTDENINKAWEWAQKSSPYGVTRIETFAKSIEAKIKEKNEH